MKGNEMAGYVAHIQNGNCKTKMEIPLEILVP
jgi:hypothetical protein